MNVFCVENLFIYQIELAEEYLFRYWMINGDKDQIEPWLLNLFENLPTCEQSSGNNSVINSLVSNLLDRLSEIDNFSNLFIIYDPSGNLSVSDDGGEKGEKSFLMPTSDYVIEKFHHCCHIIGDFKL
ncbi:hypothetical protein T09_7863 [Trichinella sp. T9]|nr:hypothetical protein T09_7863 [Trichinella sp. T9]